MLPTEDEDIRDVIAEAQSPGKVQKKVLSLERKRKFKNAARMLTDPKVTFREYVQAIREIEPREESPEFVEAVKLWYEYRAKH